MKNKLLALLLIFLNISCSNESSNPEDGNSGMLKKIEAYIGNNSVTVHDFYYKDGSKLDRIEVRPTHINRSHDLFIIKYTYANDLITRNGTYFDDNPAEQNSNIFIYNNNQIIRYEREFSYKDIYNFTYSTIGSIDVEEIRGIDNSVFNSRLNFDTQQNMISIGLITNPNTTYEYDNKFSPYYGILGLDKIHFIDQYSQFHTYPIYYNNIVNYTFYENNLPYSRTYTYEYNNNNKPIVKKDSSGKILEQYYYY